MEIHGKWIDEGQAQEDENTYALRECTQGSKKSSANRGRFMLLDCRFRGGYIWKIQYFLEVCFHHNKLVRGMVFSLLEVVFVLV